MRTQRSVGLLWGLVVSGTHAWAPLVSVPPHRSTRSTFLASSISEPPQQPQQDETTTTTSSAALTVDVISKLTFRELQAELQHLQLSTAGTTGQLRSRLKQAVDADDECLVPPSDDDMDNDCLPNDNDELNRIRVQFVDESDPDFEAKQLLNELDDKVQKGHWKAALRKLKRYSRLVPVVEESTIACVLQVCMDHRLQGARASEPVRKLLELLVEQGYGISETAGNYCIRNCLGYEGPQSTHQGFGGLDTALAMLAALRQAKTPIQLETYDKLVTALAKEGSLTAAVSLLRTVVNDESETPALATFAATAQAAVSTTTTRTQDDDTTTTTTYADQVPAILGLAKASGYDLDTVASIDDGRHLLACGIIASEQMDNVGLGLRLLTAAGKVSVTKPYHQNDEDEDEDVEEEEPTVSKGDVLVASYSSMAQRASTLIHKRAINRAVQDKQWKLAVKVLELMLERSLKPSPWIWRNVVTCCAKAEKSKKASSLLLQWVAAYEQRSADMPPLSVFNTVMNACEICNEEDLTLQVLDAMKKTHNVEGNIITFNIALKRLAKQGNMAACEGIILSMLSEGVEPTVVSYTTAIAACVVGTEGQKQPDMAYEWLKRMRSRLVFPNVLTYNTVLAACEDGTLASAVLGSRVASEMLVDAEQQLKQQILPNDNDTNTANAMDSGLTNVIPNSSTKFLARRLLKQMEDAVSRGEMDGRVAQETVQPSLTALVEYVNCATDECFLEKTAVGRQQQQEQQSESSTDEAEAASDDDDDGGDMEEDEIGVTSRDEMELEYTAVSDMHRIAEV